MTSTKASTMNGDIIVVEDSPTQREQIGHLLESHGFIVRLACDGKQALELFHEHQPDLVISDIVMPEMNGYELCKQIKSQDGNLDIPVILLTSLSNAEDVLEGLACGADNFITKPYNEDFLLLHVQQILANKTLHKNERVRVGVEIMFGGKRRFVTADQQQMLTLLISTYEAAVSKNAELLQTQSELRLLNEQLEEKVEHRTAALTQEVAVRKQAEEHIKNQNRVHSVLSNVNQTIVREHNIGKLFKDICRIAVEDGKFQSASIGMVNAGTKELDIIESAGAPSDVGLAIHVDLNDKKQNQTPAAIAVRTGKHLIWNDVVNDATNGVRSKNGVRFGPGSTAAMPIRVEGEVCGVINLTSNEIGFFDEDEISLLDEMAMDVSFALEFIQKEAERKGAEKQLRQSEELFRLIAENATDLIAVLDLEGKRIYSSPSYKSILGDPQSLRGTDSFQEIHPEDQEKIKRIFLETVRTGIGQRADYRFLLEDGSVHYIESQGNVIRDQNGNTDKVVVVSREVTERKRAETALKESEDKYRRVVETALEGVWFLDSEFKTTEVNDAVVRMLGYIPEELIGRPFIDLVFEEDRPTQVQEFQQRSRGISGQYERRLRCKDGSVKWLFFSAKAVMSNQGAFVGTFAMITDITERKRAEEEINRLAKFPSENPNPVLRLNRDGIVLYANKASGALLGMWGCAVGSSAPQFWRDLVAQVLASREDKTVEVECNGKVYSMVVTPVAEQDYINLYGRDITERKRAEAALRDSEARYRMLFEASVDGILIADVETKTFKYANPALCRMLGYTEEELRTLGLADIHPKQDLQRIIAEFEAQARGDKTLALDIPCLRKDGTILYADINTASLTIDGRPYNMGLFRDTTERKKAEESRLLLTTALESAANGVTITDRQGNIVWVNKAFAAMTGYTWTDVLGQNPRILKSGKQDDSFYRDLWETISKGNVWTGELINKKKDGGLYVDGTTITPLKNVNGEITNFIAIRQDITERKKAEREIRIFGHAIKSIGECISITDLDNKVLFVNEAFLKTYGYEERELLGKNIEIVGSDNNKTETAGDILHATIHGSWHGEVVNRRKDGSEFPVSLSTSVVTDDEGKATALIGVAVDITERKKAEETLKDSEERLKILFEYAPDAYYLNDLKGTFIDGNKAAEELTGYSRKELIGKNFLSLHLLQSKQLVKAASLLAQNVIGRPTGPDEFNMKRKDGSEVAAEIQTFPVKIKDKTLVLGMARDITDRIRSESEIRKNRELLNSIFETSRDGIMLEDEHGIITFANNACVKLYGYEHEKELIGKHVSIVRAPEDNDRLLEYSRKRLSGEDSPSIYEYKGRCKDGNLVDLEVSVAVTEIGGKKHILSVVRDIRDRKKAESERQSLEERMRQAQKMESIGTLAGGIAHDFNNILGIILGHLSIVTRPEYDEAMRTASAETISSAVRRGANLVRQILTFARKSEVELVPVNVNESAKEIRKMLEQTIPKSIEFAIQLEKGLPFVIIDAGQLHQALLNLCVNARDAIVDAKRETGVEPRITLKTALVMGKKLRERFPEVSAEQYVAISVSDTGTGMDETTRKRIFEPFFTTKEKGKGTGLGLAVVYGVVKSARGIVDVESEPGHGSVFTLYLPVPKEANLSEPRHEKRQTEVPGGTETILIVEDEESMLAILQMSLEKKGYRIISAIDGREAMELFKQQQDHIDLVITDLGLPKISGELVVRLLRKIKPSIKVIVASGYVDVEQRSELLALGAKDIIMKPYDQTEVQEKVREVLDAR